MLRNTIITTIATPGSGSEFRTGASGVKVGDETTQCGANALLVTGNDTAVRDRQSEGPPE
jgi:hypothetical protein